MPGHDRAQPATDHLRQSRDQVELPDDLPGGDPIEAETFAVLEVVRGLPDAYRETLLMRLVEGMSGNENRRALGVDASVGARESAPWDEDAARKIRVARQ